MPLADPQTSQRAAAFRLCLLIGALALGLAAGSARADEVTVFAAVSTGDALADLAERYAADGGDKVRTVLAASSTLAKQIDRGAPADLFLSANLAWMDYLAERGAVDPDSRTDLLGNRLVLIVRRGGDDADDRFDELAGPAIGEALRVEAQSGKPVALADPEHVPAGRYAKAALESLGLWRDLEGRAVRTADVRAALALVDRGEAAAGIVYATDAALSPRVRVVGRLPQASHPPIVYPLALVGAPASAAARRFYDHLQSTEAAEVFRSHGFSVLSAAGQ